MNLPNAMTVARIAAAPIIAVLIVLPVWQLRFGGWLLYVAAAVTDYYDGKLARSRNLVTDLGQLLDPIADKALLVFTLLPILWLMRGVGMWEPLPAGGEWAYGSIVGPVALSGGEAMSLPFVTPIGLIGLHWWVVAIVLGREVLMTVFRQAAARRGLIIAAIGPAKWKTGFQLVWVGAAFFWFFAALGAVRYGWTSPLWRAFAMFNGIVGAVSMAGAVLLTIYSMWLYLRRYGSIVVGTRAPREG